jgi:hypothetical protein
MIRRLALCCACIAVLVALSAWAVGQISADSRGDGPLVASAAAARVAVSAEARAGAPADHERRPCRDRLAGSRAPCAAFATLSSTAEVARPSPECLTFALLSDRIIRQELDDTRFRPPRPPAGAARA